MKRRVCVCVCRELVLPCVSLGSGVLAARFRGFCVRGEYCCVAVIWVLPSLLLLLLLLLRLVLAVFVVFVMVVGGLLLCT